MNAIATRTVSAKVPGKPKGAKTLTLEWLRLEITRKWDKGWDLYFLIEVEHPTEKNKKVALTFPSQPLNLSKRDDNEYLFGHREGKGREGSEVCVIPMPDDESVSVQVFAFQAKDKARATGRVLKTVSDFADAEVASKLSAAAATNPYVAAGIIVNKGVGVVGKLLAKTKDKSRGFAALDERFEDRDIENGQTTIRRAVFTGGDLALVYRWRVSD